MALRCSPGATAGKADRSGVCPLHYAASAGHLDIIDLLLQRGAKVDCLSGAGHTVFLPTSAGITTLPDHLIETPGPQTRVSGPQSGSPQLICNLAHSDPAYVCDVF